MSRPQQLSPTQFAKQMLEANQQRGYLVYDAPTRTLRGSHPIFQSLGDWLLDEAMDYCEHEAVFFAVGPESHSLMTVFVHSTRRGQAQGGLRRWSYTNIGNLLKDGLRLSAGMTRKNALAGLWWGGGKGILAQDESDGGSDSDARSLAYREYGAFVSSLRGCYLTAEDVGTSPVDIGEVFRFTRFVTCIAPEFGGSGNPSPMTAAGVIRAMEAALDFLAMGTIAGKTIALQGTGNVGSEMIPLLLERGVRRIVAADVSAARRSALLDTYAGHPLEIHLVRPGNLDVLFEPCDVLAPAALGGVLNPKTIPEIQASLVCGPANNQLLDDTRDGAALEARGIAYVPDFVGNRMGIVYCGNEQYGYVNGDPMVTQHLDRDWPGGIFKTTQRVLELARSSDFSAVTAADRLADELAKRTHPIWGHRARKIIESLVADRWERGQAR
jgi:glutamate dehydrogenase/leucine dehydrogenase